MRVIPAAQLCHLAAERDHVERLRMRDGRPDAFRHVLLVGGPGNTDNGHVWSDPLLDLAEIMTVHDGHVEVEHDDAGFLLDQPAQAVCAVFGRNRVVTFRLQCVDGQRARAGVVVDDQDAMGHKRALLQHVRRLERAGASDSTVPKPF